MTWRLYASRWSNSFSSPVKLENLDGLANVGVRWQVPGGVQRIELMIRARSRADAYDRYNRHHGQRIIITDNFQDGPVMSGQIYEIVPDGRWVNYLMAGTWKRHNDRFYTIDNFQDITTPTDDTDVVIKDILDDKVTLLSTDRSQIAASGVNIGGWHPPEEIGIPAGDAIAELASIGDSSSNPMDYYVIERPFLGARPQSPVPVLEVRSKTAAPDWLIAQEDLAGGGLQQSRHVWEFKTDVRIGYGRVTGSKTGTTSATVLTDTSANFIVDGVTVGDVVTNITDGSTGEVSNVGSATQLTVHALSGGTDNDFDFNDRYSIQMQRPRWTSSDTSASLEATIDLWTVEFRDVQMDMDATQAALYRSAILSLYEQPVQQQAIVIGAPTIRDAHGARWPLWRVLAHNGGYVRFLDFAPEVVSGSERGADHRRSFRIAAMDYTYKNNQLRLVPDLPDSRLDAILRQAGLLSGQLISSTPEAKPQAASIVGSRRKKLGFNAAHTPGTQPTF